MGSDDRDLRAKGYVCILTITNRADVVQLAERQLPKLNVAGSSPVIRSTEKP